MGYHGDVQCRMEWLYSMMPLSERELEIAGAGMWSDAVYVLENPDEWSKDVLEAARLLDTDGEYAEGNE